jgi:hypothetical protein
MKNFMTNPKADATWSTLPPKTKPRDTAWLYASLFPA